MIILLRFEHFLNQILVTLKWHFGYVEVTCTSQLSCGATMPKTVAIGFGSQSIAHLSLSLSLSLPPHFDNT